MRDSLNRVVDALKDSDITPLSPSREPLAKSNWLKHISNMLDGASLIARQVGIHHSHVLIHCSDGWDRTSQLSALSQLCLDPYYRTMEGFMVLVEKDFVSFGHMFKHRSGFLGSEKWFEIENERIGGGHRSGNESPFGGTGSRTNPNSNNAFENALLSAKGFFNKHNPNNHSQENLAEADELPPYSESSSPARTASPSSRKAASADDPSKAVTKVKETSPVFHQFLDATYQLVAQHPNRFEFNERFLRRLLYHLYSCQYGTFLFDNEKQRVEAKLKERTRSVWDYFLARKDMFTNQNYVEEIDDNVRGKERLVFPNLKEVKWWAEVFGRSDEEMNAPPRPSEPSVEQDMPAQTQVHFESANNSTVLHDATDVNGYEAKEDDRAELDKSTLEGIETANAANFRANAPSARDFPSTGLGVGSRDRSGSPKTVSGTSAIAAGLAGLAVESEAQADPEVIRGQSKGVSREVEVEMQ